MLHENAWNIYGDTGLLEISDSEHQNFSITLDQYGDPVFSEKGYLTQFLTSSYRNIYESGPYVVTPEGVVLGKAEKSYVIREEGIFVGSEGLSIINSVEANKIIFISNKENWINLLGSINVYNHPAEIIFITSYNIYCNGCNFPGLNEVKFLTVPKSSYLLKEIFFDYQNIYFENANSDSKIHVGSKGMLSSSVSLYALSGSINVAGSINLGNVTLEASSANFNSTFIGNNLDANIECNLLFHELYLAGDANVRTFKYVINDKSYINGEAYFNVNSYTSSKTFSKNYNGKELYIYAGTEAILNNYKVNGNLTIISDSEAILNNVLSSGSIFTLSPNLKVSELVKSNQLLELQGDIISIDGIVQSPNIIEIGCNNLEVYKVLEAGKSIKAKINNKLSINPGAKFISQGDVIITSYTNNTINELTITSASFEVGGNALIKAEKLINQRSGTYKIEPESIEAAKSGNHWDDKWQLRMSCYKEKFIDNTGPESKTLIGGNLEFQGDKIHNSLSKFEIGGSRIYINKTPVINDGKIDLKIVGNFHCVPAEGKYHSWCVDETRDRLSKYCGLVSQGLISGSVNKPYNTIGTGINDQSQIAREQASKVKLIEDIKIASPNYNFESHNQEQKPFNDHRTKADSTKKADNKNEEEWFNFRESSKINTDDIHTHRAQSIQSQKTKLVA
ncbi:hypothetical protein H1Q59_08315 [Holosporaceae bacterium 'Namur']|nr:hypothetical protein [Holosporaceae bacterium 'Namur']